MTEGRIVSMQLIKRLFTGAHVLGVEPARLLDATGLTVEELADREAMTTHATLLTVWKHAVALTGDPAFAIHAAELSRRSPDNVLAHAFQHSRCLRDAIGCVSRYMTIVHRGAEIRLVENRATAAMRVVPRPGITAAHHGVEFALAVFCVAAREYVRDFSVREVTHRHGPPQDDAEHRRVYGGPVRFHADHDEVVFDANLLSARMRDADPALASLLERHLDELVRHCASGSLLYRVRRAIAGDLGSGHPSAEFVAARLHMSVRSLQRRLRENDTSFSQEVDQVRRDLATSYLAEPNLSVAEIGYLLGFAEVSTFHRAFKRWTGHTPSESRRSGSVPVLRPEP